MENLLSMEKKQERMTEQSSERMTRWDNALAAGRKTTSFLTSLSAIFKSVHAEKRFFIRGEEERKIHFTLTYPQKNKRKHKERWRKFSFMCVEVLFFFSFLFLGRKRKSQIFRVDAKSEEKSHNFSLFIWGKSCNLLWFEIGKDEVNKISIFIKDSTGKTAEALWLEGLRKGK